MYNTSSSKISNKYIFTAKNKRKKQAKLGNKKKEERQVRDRTIFTKYFSIYVQYLLKSLARTLDKEKNNKRQEV